MTKYTEGRKEDMNAQLRKKSRVMDCIEGEAKIETTDDSIHVFWAEWKQFVRIETTASEARSENPGGRSRHERDRCNSIAFKAKRESEWNDSATDV